MTATWLVDTDIPDNINDGSQPAQGPDGVRHRVLSCEQVEGDLVYQVRFDNPYDRELAAVVATALDVGDRGSIWGFFKVALPPGSVRAVFDTANIPMPEREALLHQTLPLITHPVEECSVHLLGFYEGAEFHIVFPVAYKRFDSDFVPTD